jgi:Fur family transcriptional regulator, peroxide stress response regulator
MDRNFRESLKEKGLKVTPQRVAIFEAMTRLANHPTAEDIIAFIKKNHPNVSVGTVYKVLDTFVDHNLLIRVKTEKDVMRYDHCISNHHHLYCAETERIEDYHDEKLTELIDNYFKKNKIANFTIQDVKLQLTGKFKK